MVTRRCLIHAIGTPDAEPSRSRGDCRYCPRRNQGKCRLVSPTMTGAAIGAKLPSARAPDQAHGPPAPLLPVPSGLFHPGHVPRGSSRGQLACVRGSAGLSRRLAYLATPVMSCEPLPGAKPIAASQSSALRNLSSSLALADRPGRRRLVARSGELVNCSFITCHGTTQPMSFAEHQNLTG